MRPVLHRDRLFWGLWGAFLACKVLFLSHLSSAGLDGSYYLDIAHNLHQGYGLTSDLSLYHQGLPSFPHSTPIYPVWSLLMAALSFVMPWMWVAHGVPAALHLATLILLWMVAVRVAYVPLFRWRSWVIHSGHVLVLIFGLHNQFFVDTTRPYTEGLAYFLLALLFLRGYRLFTHPEFAVRGWRTGLEMGFWVVLLFLTRAQLLLVTLAFFSVLPVALWFGQRRVWWKISVGFVLGAGLTLAPQVLFLSSQFKAFSPKWMLRFDQFRMSPKLSRLVITKPTRGLNAFLKDRAKGFPIAFSRTRSRFSYMHNFHWFQFGLLVALPLWCLWGMQWFRNGSWEETKHWLQQPLHLYQLFLLSFSIAGFLSIHTIHKQLFAEWNFAARHAITCAFFFFVAWVSIARFRRWLRPLVLIAVLYSSIVGFQRLHKRFLWQSKQTADIHRLWHIVHWLNDHSADGKRFVVVTRLPQLYAPMTPDTSYHWIHGKTRFEDVRYMFERLGARVLIVSRATKRYKLFKDPRFPQYFRLHKQNVSGLSLYVPRSKPLKRSL
jgi:hypothetical protein